MKAKWTEDVARDLMAFHSISLVPAPRCEACRQAMVTANDREWQCVTEECQCLGVPVHTGVYPFARVRKVGVPSNPPIGMVAHSGVRP